MSFNSVTDLYKLLRLNGLLITEPLLLRLTMTTPIKVHWNISREMLIKIKAYASFHNISTEAAANALLEKTTANIKVVVE